MTVEIMKADEINWARGKALADELAKELKLREWLPERINCALGVRTRSISCSKPTTARSSRTLANTGNAFWRPT
jgi:hypothetical protein